MATTPKNFYVQKIRPYNNQTVTANPTFTEELIEAN